MDLKEGRLTYAQAEIKKMYGGRCAYTGLQLDKNWRIDHIRIGPEERYMVIPALRAVTEYKGYRSFEEFREYMKRFHHRARKLPRIPRKKESMAKIFLAHSVGAMFQIDERNSFSGLFWFETEEGKAVKERCAKSKET